MAWTYPRRLGIALDKFLNVVVFDGEVDMTISEHSARADRGGKAWGCVMCRLLSALVEHDHCRKVLSGETTPDGSAIRAFGLLILLYVTIDVALRAVLEALFHVPALVW